MLTTDPTPVSSVTAAPRERVGALPALAALGGLLGVVLPLLGFGFGVEGWRTATRATARWSVFVFLSLFLAEPLARWSRARAVQWLKSQYRSLIFAFASAHFIHLIAILTYFAVGGTVPPPVVVGFGALGYLLIALLVAASTDRAYVSFGAANWRRLHVFVLYYVWLIFALTYISRIAKGPDRLAPGAVLALLAAALVARLVTPLVFRRVRES
jgi:hypothetical protein